MSQGADRNLKDNMNLSDIIPGNGMEELNQWPMDWGTKYLRHLEME